jgi:hypothetical protein
MFSASKINEIDMHRKGIQGCNCAGSGVLGYPSTRRVHAEQPCSEHCSWYYSFQRHCSLDEKYYSPLPYYFLAFCHPSICLSCFCFSSHCMPRHSIDTTSIAAFCVADDIFAALRLVFFSVLKHCCDGTTYERGYRSRAVSTRRANVQWLHALGMTVDTPSLSRGVSVRSSL